MSDTANPLFQPVLLGALDLEHRVVMAPLTRLRSRQLDDVPQQLNAAYYGQRASRGELIITEATDVATQARSYPGAPGIYSDAQIAGWKLVTDAVHAKGGRIVLQIWQQRRYLDTHRNQRNARPPGAGHLQKPRHRIGFVIP
jgi:N-ethylmaleimide reductase